MPSPYWTRMIVRYAKDEKQRRIAAAFVASVPQREALAGWSCMTDAERRQAFATGVLPKITNWRPA